MVCIVSAVIGMSLCRVWHLCNLPCVYTLLRLISNARYVSKNMLSRDKIWNLPWTCCLLASYSVTPVPAVWLQLHASTVCRFLSRISYLSSLYVFLRRRRSFTSRKLYVCLESFLCFLHISDRACVSRARCLGLGLGLFHHSSWYLNTFQPESMPMRTISSWTSRSVQILNYFLSYFQDFEIKTNAKKSRRFDLSEVIFKWIKFS